jgi:hypothetical protein
MIMFKKYITEKGSNKYSKAFTMNNMVIHIENFLKDC